MENLHLQYLMFYCTYYCFLFTNWGIYNPSNYLKFLLFFFHSFCGEAGVGTRYSILHFSHARDLQFNSNYYIRTRGNIPHRMVYSHTNVTEMSPQTCWWVILKYAPFLGHLWSDSNEITIFGIVEIRRTGACRF
jgi:hypothetical protein